MILQSSRKVGMSPPKPLRSGSELLLGTGMVMVMGLWNFLLRGSRVTGCVALGSLLRNKRTEQHNGEEAEWKWRGSVGAIIRSGCRCGSVVGVVCMRRGCGAKCVRTR